MAAGQLSTSSPIIKRLGRFFEETAQLGRTSGKTSGNRSKNAINALIEKLNHHAQI
jgi:hypothetical protein